MAALECLINLKYVNWKNLFLDWKLQKVYYFVCYNNLGIFLYYSTWVLAYITYIAFNATRKKEDTLKFLKKKKIYWFT